MPHATVPSPGLQALILCGPGSSLTTFTSNPKDFPKALIPVANRPMVWYPLDWCYRMGISDITLVTPPESEGPLQSALATNPSLTSLPNPKPEILAPTNLTQTTGTGELLRLPEIQKAITSDLIILPCDLISELDGNRIIQQWMTLNELSASSSSSKRKGGLSVFYPTQGLDGISHKKDETDFIGTVKLPSPAVPPPQGSLRPNIEELVTSMPTDTLKDTIEEDKDKTLRIRASLLSRFGHVKLRMKHRDAHIYVFPRWIKDFAAKNDSFESISEDIMGWWAKAGWQEGLRPKLALDEVLSEGGPKGMEDSIEGAEEEIDASALSSTKVASRLGQSDQATAPAFASRVSNAAMTSLPKQVQVPPLLAYVQPQLSPSNPTQPLIRRIDTSHQLLTVSLYLAKQAAGSSTLAHEHKVHPTAQLGQQSRVSQEDSLVAENVNIGSRVNVKECVIGANCEIAANVRLTRCLLMEGVHVGEGVQLTGCIVGRRARFEGMKSAEAVPAAAASGNGAEGAGKKQRRKGGGGDDDDRTKLTDCEVAPQFVVDAGTEAKGEQLMAFETEGMLDDGDFEGDSEGTAEDDREMSL